MSPPPAVIAESVELASIDATLQSSGSNDDDPNLLSPSLSSTASPTEAIIDTIDYKPSLTSPSENDSIASITLCPSPTLKRIKVEHGLHEALVTVQIENDQNTNSLITNHNAVAPRPNMMSQAPSKTSLKPRPIFSQIDGSMSFISPSPSSTLPLVGTATTSTPLELSVIYEGVEQEPVGNKTDASDGPVAQTIERNDLTPKKGANLASMDPACASSQTTKQFTKSPTSKPTIPRERSANRSTIAAAAACSTPNSVVQTTNVISNTQARLIDLGKQLLDATRDGHTELVRKLVIESGAPFTSDWLGTTALHFAAQIGSTEIADILLRGGVNRDARTKLERTALHFAAQNGSPEMVDLLLVHGCDVNALDMLKMTPLHWAVEKGHLEVTERLLNNGADVNMINKFQLTPLEIAQNHINYEMIEVIRSYESEGSSPKSINVSDCFVSSLGFTTSQIISAQVPKLIRDIDVEHQINPLQSHLNYRNQLALVAASGSANLGCDDDDDVSSEVDRVFGIDEPCMDLVELEWNMLKTEPEFFLTSEDDSSEPKVEYLMKIVGELKKENIQLRKKVEQLETNPSTTTP